MRKINKEQELDVFSDFVRRYPTAVWNDLHRLAPEVYQQTRFHILTEEQHSQCGYTEMPIETEKDAHIDHYMKRSFQANRTFEWDNLIVATNDDDFGAKYKDNGYKIREAEYTEIFNPVLDEVQSYFYYNEFGKIQPLDTLDAQLQQKVKRTIEIFRLEHPSLVDRRKTLVNTIRSYEQGGIDYEEIKDYLSSMGFKSLIEQYCR